MIYLLVHDELYVDKFHEKDSQLYKVMQDISTPNGIMVVDWTPGLLAQTLKNEMPEIEYAVQIYSGEWFNGILAYDNKFYRANGQFVGKDFFDVFSYPLIQGDKSKVLSDKNAVIISEEMAVILFHTTENIIGKTIEWSQNNSTGFGGMFSISGVFKDIPKNSTQHFDLIFNYEFFSEKYSSQVLDWRNSAGTTNVILKKGAEVIKLNEKISNLIGAKSGLKERRFFLKQFSKIYLYGTYENGIQVGGRIDYIRLFSIIALFILAIASINFMNLSTAKASRRIKEVGIKKSFGVTRKNLVFQFMGESILITFLSLFIAILLVGNFLPQFNEITGKHLQFNFSINIILSVLGITFFTGLISGSYPAIYLSGFNPVVVLKGKLNTSLGELWVRKGLVIFQFTISVIFIVLVLVVYQQMVYIQTKYLGYSRNNIICISKEGALNETGKLSI